MRTRKTIVALLAVLLPVVSWGQQEKEETKNTPWKGFETNRFWDNWFISLGGGGQVFFGQDDQKGPFGERISPTMDLSVGKWIVPALGLRAQFNGFSQKGFTTLEDNEYITGPTDIEGVYKQKWDQIHIRGDVMFNLSNWIGGYRTDRFWEFVPFLGVGFMHNWGGSVHNEFTFNAGLINKLKLTEALDLNLELRGSVFDGKYNGELDPKDIPRPNGMATVTIGLTYKFKNRYFHRCGTASKREIETLKTLKETESRLQMAVAENASLKDSLKNRPEITVPVTVDDCDCDYSQYAVFFPLDISKVDEREKINLREIAEQIKKDTGSKYLVLGYADKETATPPHNQKLSDKRAENVAKFLIEFGVNPDQIKVEGKGGISSGQLFDKPYLNRVVIIKQDK